MVLNMYCYSHSCTVIFVKHAVGTYAKIVVVTENNTAAWMC